MIGTPGRILELMKAKKIKAHQVKTMVFDEADQLFDAGNSQIIDQILHQAPTEYQLAFFQRQQIVPLKALKNHWENV